MSTTLNQSKYNWGEQLKVEVGDLNGAGASGNGAGPRAALPVGRFQAFLQEVKPGTFKTGSYGVKFTYVIEEGPAKNRKITESVVLTKADGTVVAYSGSRLKRRLMNFGMPLEKINAFKGPRNEHDLGDFKLVLGAPVTIEIKDDGIYNGAPSRKVGAVYIRELAA